MGHTGLLKQKTNTQAIFGLVAAAVLLLATFVSTVASADALTSMSIVPSTSSVNAGSDVQYGVTFTPKADAGAVVIDFCDNTPLLGQSCDAPDGMDVSGAASADATINGATTDNKIVAAKVMTADNEQTITLTGLKNPTTAGVIFARIITYATVAEAALYESEDPTNADLDPDPETGELIVPIDNGSVSMFFNSDINVSGTVLETLTFCVASVALTPACANAEDDLASLVLGDEQGEDSGIFALTTGKIHEKSLFAQINTNAATGAVVRLRSSAPCGGLIRAGTDICDIAPAPGPDPTPADAGFDGFGAAHFGVKLGAATSTPADGSTTAVGTLKAATGSLYDNLKFKIGYVSGGDSGVTSTLGDPFLDTDGEPATDQNMELVFGATVTNSTPAGTYSTDLSMIAVGKF